MGTLTYIVIVLGLLAGWKLIRVYELSEELRGSDTEEVTESDNKWNGILMLVMTLGFLAMAVYEVITYQQFLLPPASSLHGPEIDMLLFVTFVIIGIPFVACHLVLGWFAFAYFMKEGREAYYVSHNNRLEFIWTAIPTVVLFALIFYGLAVWDSVIYPTEREEETLVVEVLGKQFQWVSRYPGDDDTLGVVNYRLIEGTNTMGLDMEDPNAHDDIVILGEMHLPVNREVRLQFRSQDVIHSAYLPHFRVQMNCVPGMATSFRFTPTKTSQDMKEELGDEKFEYLILCNKICGSAHYTMKMLVVVESEEDYNKWLGEQKVFYASEESKVIPVETLAEVEETSIEEEGTSEESEEVENTKI
ncbi:MAG: cytochrome C oxidase subunit II [Bacteroidetes bacterium]|nr:MAG: cytochrome C oxidase subunit II [Bacteroidota bacterium]